MIFLLPYSKQKFRNRQATITPSNGMNGLYDSINHHHNNNKKNIDLNESYNSKGDSNTILTQRKK